MTCLLNNKLVSTIFWQFSKRQKFLELSLKQHYPNTRHEKRKGLCKTRWVERHSCQEAFDELYEHEVAWLRAIWLIHMFIQRLIKVVGIGIVTPRQRLMVWKVDCRVLELLLASHYWRIVWINWKVCQLNYKEDILTSLRHRQWLTISNERFNGWGMTLV